MNLREVLHVVGALLAWSAGAMLPSAGLGIGEGLLGPWLIAAGATGLAGLTLWLGTPKVVSINPREGLAVVGLGWLAVVAFGSLPFLATGVVPSVPAALFESVSGFTTTGASVFPVIEDLPRSILLWRSMSHWVGGMGIIVLGVAILPLLGVGGAQLFRAEAPGISNDRLTPRIASTARLLWGVYALFTVVLGLAYLVLGMAPFDAINHAMSTLATGGFSTRTASLGAFGPAIQWITILFMFLAAANFTLHLRALSGKPMAMLRDPEFRWYLISTVAVIAIAFAVLSVGAGGASGRFRAAAFNVVAIHTTTGFATEDFAAWPALLQVLLLGLMFMGGMGGSTAGGFKVVRAAVVTQHVFNEIRKVRHPRAVVVTRLGRQAVRPDIVLNVLAFLALYMFTHALGTVALTALGHDLITAMSASLSAMSSVGPGLGTVGPASHYGDVGSAAQLVLSALMLLGRLEFYTLLVLVVPETWNRAGGHR
ncbi:MAG: TrkH family potassium uptake protein [Gemmatimonadales bacterium]